MILHLVNDEKIINRTIDIFEEVFPSQNIVVVSNRATNKFFHIKKGKNVLSRKEFLEKKDQYNFSKIFIHLLNKRKMDIIKKIPLNGVTIYWIIWGVDLYNNLLETKGFEIADNNSSYSHRRSLHNSAIWKSFSKEKRKAAAKRTISFVKKNIDYIVTDTTENDYDYLLKYYPELKDIKWKSFFYYPIDVILGNDLPNKTVIGNNIMIGNSASFTNNHEYVMKFLFSLNLRNRKVYMPLCYSAKKRYVETVVDFGRKYLPNNFSPIFNFMPLKAYNELQASISVALFGNWRQEAIGNILIFLYLGTKVFLSHKTPVFEWAKSHNLIVFELESITQEAIDSSLSEEQKIHNKEILLKLYNKKRMKCLIESL